MRIAVALLATMIAASASAQDSEQPVAPEQPEATEEPGAEIVADAPDADAAVAATEAPVRPARTPRVALVIAGDADPEMVAAAETAEAALRVETPVTMPSDEALRRALRGEGESSDGLDEVRAERRRLGLGEARDVLVLTILGERAGADLVLVVRRHHGAIEATSFDVARRSFYDGEVDLDALDPSALRQFAARRAARAARPLVEGERAPAPEVATLAATPEETPHEPDWFEQNWPFFAAGALLVGAVIFIVFATTGNAEPPPVLRFEAGGGS